jgi:hypothetical protein
MDFHIAKGNAVPTNATKYIEVGVQRQHVFGTSTLASRHLHAPTASSPSVLTEWETGLAHSRSERFGEGLNSLFVPGIEP